MYPSSRSSRTFFSRADNGNSERVNSGPNRAPKLHAHLKAFPGIITWPSGKHVRTRGVRARGEKTVFCIRPVIHRLRLKIHLCVLEAEERRGRRRRGGRREKKEEEKRRRSSTTTECHGQFNALGVFVFP